MAHFCLFYYFKVLYFKVVFFAICREIFFITEIEDLDTRCAYKFQKINC